MTSTEEFQKAHGGAWVQIIAQPAFQAALALLSSEAQQRLTTLTPAEIKEHGSQLLAEYIGQLKHENDLVTLHERRTFDPANLPPETYGAENHPDLQDSSAASTAAPAKSGGKKRR